MVADPLQKIGQEIKDLRIQRGLSVAQLAKESRVAMHHIESIEKYERANLPEEAYLSGFLVKLLRALGHEQAEKRVETFKRDEGSYIVENLVNNSSSNEADLKVGDEAYFKLYHFYIIIGLLLFLVFWFLLVNSFTEHKTEVQGGILGSSKKPKLKRVVEQLPSEVLPAIDKNGLVQTENLQILTPEKPLPVVTTRRGGGNQQLDLYVKEVAWVQVIGVASKEILYEGDVFPDQGPNHLQLFDDAGFVVATGNAGAFEVATADGTHRLGQEGERIKWFYPQSAKMVYKTKDFDTDRKKKRRRS